MPEYLSPAVFIEEVPAGNKPIEGVGTSTGAFVGHAERGPIGEAIPVTNFGQYVTTFGSYTDDYLAYAVKNFFDEGGRSCYVVRTCNYAVPSGGSSRAPTALASSLGGATSGRNGLTAGSKTTAAAGFVEFRSDGSQGNKIFLLSYVAASNTFTLTSADGATDTASVAAAAIASGATEIVIFTVFGLEILLDENFDKAADITVDADTVAIATGGAGVINPATVRITGSSGDVFGIDATTLTLGNLTTPASISITAGGGFSGTFDGGVTGVQTIDLIDASANLLQIEFDVTIAFDGAEPTGTVELHELENLLFTTAAAFRIEATSPGSWGNDIAVKIAHEGSDRFSIRVLVNGDEMEKLEDLSMDSLDDTDYVENAVNGNSDYIVFDDQTPSTSPLTLALRRPPAGESTLSGGSDGLTGLVTSDYVGDESIGSGLYAFDVVDGINIVCIPDAIDRDVHLGGMAYCSNRADCFYVAHTAEGVETADDALNYKLAQGLYSGGNALSSKYGALYTPWISVFDPRISGRRNVPPVGAVAGRYAAVDASRGVHKAAAGIEDGRLRTALDVASDFTAQDQEKLNPKGVNVIRKFSGVGRVIWGARTVSVDPEWRYVNVRRLILFIEESIKESTTWIVFEPNDVKLWKTITASVSAFLRLQWLSGALVGASEEEAYFVKCDEETNPQESIDLGRVITEIGIAPSKPAEFVIFRISQSSTGAAASE